MKTESDIGCPRCGAFRSALVLCFVLTLLGAPLLAQTTGTVRGQVVDQDQEPLPGVTLELTGELVRGSRTTVSGEGGKFLFSAVPPRGVLRNGGPVS